jgi:putative ABC transport system permease protein
LLVASGLAIGFALAWIASGALQTLLVGVGRTDPLTFASAGAVLWLVSLLASSVPAFRAVRVDPAVVLRDE